MNETDRPSGQRVAYVRVSSADQNPARQLAAVGECDQVFTEHASGKSTEGRPQLAAMIRHVRAGDTVIVSSMDRLARSLVDLHGIVEQVTGDPATHTEAQPRKGATLEFVKEHLTFAPGAGDPFAQFQLSLMGAVAQFERELIRQRQAEGIAAAKKRGAYKGRPRTLTSEQIKALRNATRAGEPKTKIARDLGVSRSTLYRYLEIPARPFRK